MADYIGTGLASAGCRRHRQICTGRSGRGPGIVDDHLQLVTDTGIVTSDGVSGRTVRLVVELVAHRLPTPYGDILQVLLNEGHRARPHIGSAHHLLAGHPLVSPADAKPDGPQILDEWIRHFVLAHPR